MMPTAVHKQRPLDGRRTCNADGSSSSTGSSRLSPRPNCTGSVDISSASVRGTQLIDPAGTTHWHVWPVAAAIRSKSVS